MSQATYPAQKRTLSQAIRDALEEKRMNNSELARRAGVNEGTIRNLLKARADDEPIKFHPIILRRVADVLELDQVQLFQLAGFIGPGYEPYNLSASAVYVGLCYDALPADQQKFLVGMLHSMMEAVGLGSGDTRALELLEEVEKLRQAHPMFHERHFNFHEEVGRIGGNWTRTTTRSLMLDMLETQLRGVLDNSDTAVVSQEHIEEVTNHPDVRFVLTTLLPRKAIPKALEKLFWLCFPWKTMDKPVKKISAEYRAGIKALWQLLERIAQVEDQSR